MAELTEEEKEAIEGLEDEASTCIDFLFDARMETRNDLGESLMMAQKSAQAILDGITAIIEAH